MGKHLALFDFDGTLTKKDSLLDFIRFSVGTGVYLKGLIVLSSVFLRLFLGLIDNSSAKQLVLIYYFSGYSVDKLSLLGREYALQRIPKICMQSGLDRIRWHVDKGHDVVIVSASADIWLRAWTDSLDINLISTRLEEKKDFFTGAYLGKNCHGMEKVFRIKKEYNINDYEKIYAYGNSSGDKFMLSIADEAYYKHFN